MIINPVASTVDIFDNSLLKNYVNNAIKRLITFAHYANCTLAFFFMLHLVLAPHQLMQSAALLIAMIITAWFRAVCCQIDNKRQSLQIHKKPMRDYHVIWIAPGSVVALLLVMLSYLLINV